MIKSRLGDEIDVNGVKIFNDKQTTWVGKCRRCNEELTGTIKEISAHVCEIKHGE